MPYVTADTSLPRSLDVQVTLSRPQAETRTDLSTLCVACEDLGFLPNANRVRLYSSIEAVEVDFVAGSEAHFAALAFFSQSPRAPQMAIGEVFLDAQPALLVSPVFTAADIALIAAEDAGGIKLNYDIGAGPVELALAALDFTGVTTVAGIAAVLDAVSGADLVISARVLPGGATILEVKTVVTGAAAVMLYATAGAANDVSALLKLTAATGASLMNGYTPSGIADELASIATAGRALGQYFYGWALGASLRDVAIQQAAAAWALGRVALIGLVSNDPAAVDPDETGDLGSVLVGNKRAFSFYHDNPQVYPEISILAYMLHVNYRLQDSTVTAKFKSLPGIATVALTETELLALQAKGYNTYTAIGLSSQTFREGVVEDSSWYLDSVINLDNFGEDLSVALYNVFLRNKKVPFTRRGQMLFTDVCYDVGNQYVYNGTFADREIEDSTKKGATSITPAIQVIPAPISSSSVADRASRIGPPIQMIVQEAGAVHSVAVNVDVVS